MSSESEETPKFQFEQDLVRLGNELSVGGRAAGALIMIR
jgi:hypothetical protein